jgi:hypothetical protein
MLIVLLLSAQQALSADSREAAWNAKNEEIVRQKVRDPDSATFRNVFFSDKSGAPVTCGEVNSRNGFGGYTGFQRFVGAGSSFGVYLEEEFVAGDFPVVWQKLCR